MHYDRKRDNKMDKKAEVIDRLRAKLEDLPAGGRQKALIKRIAAEEQQMEELSRKYDAKKMINGFTTGTSGLTKNCFRSTLTFLIFTFGITPIST